MAESRHFRLEDGNPPVLYLNEVLDWFSEDFGGVEVLPSFFAPYLSDAQRSIILREGLPVEFVRPTPPER